MYSTQPRSPPSAMNGLRPSLVHNKSNLISFISNPLFFEAKDQRKFAIKCVSLLAPNVKCLKKDILRKKLLLTFGHCSKGGEGSNENQKVLE